MRFSAVQHQDRAISILRRALRSGRTHHAYLLEGPAGVGKELAGRALAAALLCAAPDRAPDADACGQCTACRLLAAGNHPDFHLIERGLHKVHPDRNVRISKGLFLVVDLVRRFLIEPASMKPTHGPRRVFLIRDAERMNEEAQNAVLKTLEEPPGAAVLILVTASAERLLPTIRSRCQRVAFDLLPPDFVRDELKVRAELADAAAQALAGLANGRLGIALYWHQVGLLDLLGDVDGALELVAGGRVPAFGERLIELATVLGTRMLAANSGEDADEEDDEGAARGSASAKLPTDTLREALKLVLLLVAALYRDALLTQADAPDLALLAARRLRAVAQLAELDSLALDERLRAIHAAEQMLDRNVAPLLVCERLGVALRGEVPA